VAGEHAIEWLSSAQRPFLLTVLTIDPHFPYSPPRSFIPGDAALIDVEQSMASNPTRAERLRIREEYARFYRGEVAFNDQSFGTLLDSLRASGELDRTIVVFTSDHGEEFWEHGRFGHGFTLYEEVLHVPLVIRYPQLPEPGLRVKRAVRTVDVVPTLFSLLGLESPPAVAGRSLFEPAGEHPEPVFATLDLEGARFHSLRQGRWKLLVNRETGEKTLFDLEQDPREREPLSPAAHTAGARLERQLNTIAQRRSGFARSGAMEVPADVLEALEALGYAQ
jgi:arylsulfatase A-like enzyme